VVVSAVIGDEEEALRLPPAGDVLPDRVEVVTEVELRGLTPDRMRMRTSWRGFTGIVICDL
jgi:hypothetical protein